MQRIITSVLCACAALAALTVSGATTAKGSLKLKDSVQNGIEYEGEISWERKEYAVTVKEDGKPVTYRYKADDVEKLEIEKPATFDDAVAKVAKGQSDAAIPILEKLIKDYAHLQWDKIAGCHLAEAYINDNKPAKALAVCKDIIDEEPSAAYRGDLAPAYWRALLKSNRTDLLKKTLEKAMKGKDRFSRGAALIMRGDIAMEEGDESPDACIKALTDGYLRVVYLYKDDDVASKLQPEALYKAARCFEKLGSDTKANALRAELKSDYADSPWANR